MLPGANTPIRLAKSTNSTRSIPRKYRDEQCPGLERGRPRDRSQRDIAGGERWHRGDHFHGQRIYNGRKTSGAGADGGCGLKLNSTIVGEATESENGRGWVSDGTNEAQSGSCFICLGSRVTNYVSGYVGLFSRGQGTQIAQSAMPLDGLTATAAFPNAEITDVIIRINGGASGPTWGADELQVYSFASS
jgi:hypothetical protein